MLKKTCKICNAIAIAAATVGLALSIMSGTWLHIAACAVLLAALLK